MNKLVSNFVVALSFSLQRGRRDSMIVGFTATYAISVITTNDVSSNPTRGDVDSIQLYGIKFVSNLRQFGRFLLILRFPPPIKLTA